MRYSLRTLLILLLLLPPLGAVAWHGYVIWRARWQEEQWIDVGGPGMASGFESSRSLIVDLNAVAEETPEPANLEVAENTENP